MWCVTMTKDDLTWLGWFYRKNLKKKKWRPTCALCPQLPSQADVRPLPHHLQREHDALQKSPSQLQQVCLMIILVFSGALWRWLTPRDPIFLVSSSSFATHKLFAKSQLWTNQPLWCHQGHWNLTDTSARLVIPIPEHPEREGERLDWL